MNGPEFLRRLVAASVVALVSNAAHAWGDEGHEIVALIAEQHLQHDVRAQVFELLAADTTHLTSHDIASEATWADRWRDSDRNTTRVRYEGTHQWHFVDIEIKAPDFDAACFGHPALPGATPAASGPARQCVADKIAQFAAELASPTTPHAERLHALQFLLHFVGDIHQPLHAADDHDQGGNAKQVRAKGRPAAPLHHYWDTEFVTMLGPDPQTVADHLLATLPAGDAQAWASGSPRDWAMESFAAARDFAYGRLPPPQQGVRPLTTAYVHDAKKVVAQQLQKAGLRLAAVLNQAFAP